MGNILALISQSHKGVEGIPLEGLNRSQSPCLEPKHQIFLSHSGIQKNFVAQLYEDLTRVNHFPFFDKDSDSLPKGEEFPGLIFKAARQCRVAILVLSDEFFTRSKWPMIELNEFVQAQAKENPGLKLLPLYFGLKLNQLKDGGNQKRWLETWGEWAKDDDRIDVGKWVQALRKVLGPINGMEYDGVDEVSFRKSVVKAVCKLIPPDVKYDVSHIQARPQLCKAISQKLDEERGLHVNGGCRVVGLFGMAGMGKSTIAKAMCHEKYGEFGGKVCHVEFRGNNYVEQRKKVLQELTGFNPEYLPSEADKLVGVLESRMQHEKVFLCIDNVLSEEDIEEANMYLKIEYLEGSKVLMTSRSLDVLTRSLRLSGRDCMEMPELEEQDATNVFLHYARCNDTRFNKIQLDIIRRCVKVCEFSKSDLGHLEYGSSERNYLPVALKVWGTQLGHRSDNPMDWKMGLKTLTKHKFNVGRDSKHPLFSLLREGYDSLCQVEKDIFMDLALFFPQNVLYESTCNAMEWLMVMYNFESDDIELIVSLLQLDALRRKALLEDSGRDGSGFKIHDLFLEFARVEAQAEPFDRRRILHESKRSDIPHELLKRPAGGFWPSLERLGLYKSEVKRLTKATLDCCCNVEILQLYDCHQLVEIDVGGMERLMSLDLVGCEKLVSNNIWGILELKNLIWFRWRDIDEQLAPFSLDFSESTSLQVLHLDCTLWKHKSAEPLDLSKCTKLRELMMSGFHSLESLPDLEDLTKLERVYFSYARDAKSVSGLSSLTKLKVLSLYWCPEVAELPGLGGLIALETLKLVDVGITEILGLEELRQLRTLIVCDCKNLSSLGGLEYVKSLRVLDASGCEKLKEVPDYSNLEELEVVNLSHSGVCTLPRDFERLAKHGILKIAGCAGLFEPLVVKFVDHLMESPRMFLNVKVVTQSTSNRSSVFRERLSALSQEINPGMRFEVANKTGISFSPKRLTASGKLFAHYMEEVVLFRTSHSYHSQADPDFFEKKILPMTCILEHVDGGMESVARALNSGIGILSLVVAKYATCYKSSTKWRIRLLCKSILQFLEEVRKEMEIERKGKRRVLESEHLMSLAHFILEHLIKNEEIRRMLQVFKNRDIIGRFYEEAILSDSSPCRKRLLDVLVHALT